jgi:hypothetical protein
MSTLEWIADHHLGDLTSLSGVAISIIGFVVTIWNIRRSKSAAERAEKAANDARHMIRVFEAVSDFSAAIAIMEEIKRLHRTGQMDILLDRYAALRKVLIGVRKLSPELDRTQSVRIQAAITTLSGMEYQVDKSRAEGNVPNIARLNRLLSTEVDELHGMLVEMRTLDRGGADGSLEAS